jgi:hypothetical protein
MMNRRVFVNRLAGIAAMGVIGDQLWAQPARWKSAPTPITVYKSKTCGCCTAWVEHLGANGFSPLVHDEEEMDKLKDRLGVPGAVRSCHTARLNGYLIEGHVPASDIRRLLAERPKTAGLAVPGMPPMTPGMAPEGVEPHGFEVVAFQVDGTTRTFASH